MRESVGLALLLGACSGDAFTFEPVPDASAGASGGGTTAAGGTGNVDTAQDGSGLNAGGEGGKNAGGGTEAGTGAFGGSHGGEGAAAGAAGQAGAASNGGSAGSPGPVYGYPNCPTVKPEVGSNCNSKMDCCWGVGDNLHPLTCSGADSKWVESQDTLCCPSLAPTPGTKCNLHPTFWCCYAGKKYGCDSSQAWQNLGAC